MKRFLLLLLVSAGPALALAPSGEFNYRFKIYRSGI